MIKKAIFVPLIIGGVMVVLGGTVAGISAAAAGGFAFLSTAEPYVERTIEVVGSDVNINVEEVNNKVVINSSDTATTVSISVYENNHEYYTTSEDDTDFSIEYHNDIPWNIRLFYIPVNTRTMTITVPTSYQGSLDINTTNAVIDVMDISLLGELNLESVNGYITVEDVSVAQDLYVHTTNSKIELNDVTCLGDITTTSMNAYIKFTNVTASNVTASTTNGKIAGNAMDVTTKVSFTTTNGQVTVNDMNVGSEIRLITTNGEISGNVDGPATDYDVDSATTNGTNNLAGYNSQNPTTDDKILYVRSYNGVINITFK